MKLVVVGAGFSGRAILQELAPGVRSMFGTTRSEAGFSRVATTGATPLIFDGHDLSDGLRMALGEATHLVMSIAPDANAEIGSGDPLLQALAGGIRQYCPAVTWVGYLSTVGVYGDHAGDWVDEETRCKPVSVRSVARLRAEQAWAEVCREAGIPLAILRLSGIYGPGRNAFVNLAEGKARRLVKPGQVFNRVHVGDIAGATAKLASLATGGIFNITDDMPAPPQDVVVEAARIMGVTPPPETEFETADISPMARSFYGENKRVSNSRLSGTGFEFRYPHYQAGLSALWRDGNWRG